MSKPHTHCKAHTASHTHCKVQNEWYSRLHHCKTLYKSSCFIKSLCTIQQCLGWPTRFPHHACVKHVRLVCLTERTYLDWVKQKNTTTGASSVWLHTTATEDYGVLVFITATCTVGTMRTSTHVVHNHSVNNKDFSQVVKSHSRYTRIDYISWLYQPMLVVSWLYQPVH